MGWAPLRHSDSAIYSHVQAILKSKLGIEQSPYTLLGACNASLASEIKNAVLGYRAASTLQCLGMSGGKRYRYVTFMDPIAVLSLMNAPPADATDCPDGVPGWSRCGIDWG
jgi:hypothetical protein